MSDVKKTINYYSDFYSEIIGEQEERYIKFAMKRWSLKGILVIKTSRRIGKLNIFCSTIKVQNIFALIKEAS